MTATVRLRAGDACVDVAPALGASILAFSWRGDDVLRPTPPAALAQGNVRLTACYPLVPFSNRIAGAVLAFGGTTYTLFRNAPGQPHAIHGVGFERAWSVAQAHADRVTLTLDYDPARDERRGWPFAFRARQQVALFAQQGVAALALTLALESTDTRTFPFGLGWHPYFPRSEGSVLGFRAGGLWATDATQLPTRHEPIPAALAFDPPRPIGATTLDNVFTGFEGVVRLDDPARGRRVTVEGDTAAPFLVVFVPPGRDFLALEPVTHMTDAFNRHARGESGTGTRTLAPGASFSCTMRIVAQTCQLP